MENRDEVYERFSKELKEIQEVFNGFLDLCDDLPPDQKAIIGREIKAELADIKADSARREREWQEKYGWRFPNTDDDFVTLASYAGISPERLISGEYNPGQVFRIIEGHLLSKRDQAKAESQGEVEYTQPKTQQQIANRFETSVSSVSRHLRGKDTRLSFRWRPHLDRYEVDLRDWEAAKK